MEKKICKHCATYIAYYTRESCNYRPINDGYCQRFKVLKGQYETCENYVSNVKREKTRKKKMLITLEKSLTSINSIAEILKDKESDYFKQ